MIKILNRYTSAVLYTSATAETIAQAAVEAGTSRAYLSGANLSRANLSGANLSRAQNVPDDFRAAITILGYFVPFIAIYECGAKIAAREAREAKKGRRAA